MTVLIPHVTEQKSTIVRASSAATEDNKLLPEDRAVHNWYRFVLSFPAHLVRQYLEQFGLAEGATVLDPFCGTGTTLVECKKNGVVSVGVEANPMAWFASTVKLDWRPNPGRLWEHAQGVAELAFKKLRQEGLGEMQSLPLFRVESSCIPKLRTLSPEAECLILKHSISPLPLHRTLVLLQILGAHQKPSYSAHERLAVARAIVRGIGNLHFGPEVGVAPPKEDAPVVETWLNALRSVVEDLKHVRHKSHVQSTVHRGDSRDLLKILEPESVDAVITSPPYPNEKDYTRTTRLESVLLGFIRDKADLRALKRDLLRSNTRGVYKDDEDDRFVDSHIEIQRLSNAIELRRKRLGKTSGFERLYGRVTKLYFGGMARHLSELRDVLRPGAKLAYVVGDQASYLRVMIRTGHILASIADRLGYEVVGIDVFRTRLATATRQRIREEVVLLRWPGKTSRHPGGHSTAERKRSTA